ncbi:MAG: 4-(cytidine 5'-diphospho)-2-C-methyl-D-erythritol kinase [Pseudomonadota bacterium]
MRRALAPAKINLTLHVTGRRADGYHLLDSLVAFADCGDVLTLTDGDTLSVTGPFADGVPADETNLIRRALALAAAPKAVTLEKRLPHPGGIGGGSSDAAAALRLAEAALTTDQLLTLGADLPICTLARAATMRGIGEAVAPVPMPVLHAVLIHPGAHLPTPQVFQGLARSDNPPMAPLPISPDPADWRSWIAGHRNDLEPPAIAAAPIVADVLATLRAAGAEVARMSGSGATCFGLWPSRVAAEAAARALTRHGWWVQATSLA